MKTLDSEKFCMLSFQRRKLDVDYNERLLYYVLYTKMSLKLAYSSKQVNFLCYILYVLFYEEHYIVMPSHDYNYRRVMTGMHQFVVREVLYTIRIHFQSTITMLRGYNPRVPQRISRLKIEKLHSKASNVDYTVQHGRGSSSSSFRKVWKTATHSELMN